MADGCLSDGAVPLDVAAARCRWPIEWTTSLNHRPMVMHRPLHLICGSFNCRVRLGRITRAPFIPGRFVSFCLKLILTSFRVNSLCRVSLRATWFVNNYHTESGNKMMKWSRPAPVSSGRFIFRWKDDDMNKWSRRSGTAASGVDRRHRPNKPIHHSSATGEKFFHRPFRIE